jgi:hypothetical protein
MSAKRSRSPLRLLAPARIARIARIASAVRTLRQNPAPNEKKACVLKPSSPRSTCDRPCTHPAATDASPPPLEAIPIA